MRIDGDGGFSEGDIKHHIGGFASYTGQGFQAGSVLRDDAVVLFDEQAAGAYDVARFGSEESDRTDMFGEFFFAELERVFGG